MRNREGGKQRTRRVRQKKRQCDREKEKEQGKGEKKLFKKKIGVAMERVRIMVIERARITLKRKKAEQTGKNEGKSESRK